jgi:putative acetyltransferase
MVLSPDHITLKTDMSGVDETMLDLWQASWQITFPEIDFSQRRAWLTEHIAGACADGAALLGAYDGARLVGFALYDASRAYMDQLVVAPDRFGTGVARFLLDEVRTRVTSPLTLDVNQDNARACRFYKRAGFVVVREGMNERSGKLTFLMRDGGISEG